MRQLLTIPHRQRPGLCPVNGIRDLIHWRSGRDWSNEFLWGLGHGAGFAYSGSTLPIRPARCTQAPPPPASTGTWQDCLMPT